MKKKILAMPQTLPLPLRLTRYAHILIVLLIFLLLIPMIGSIISGGIILDTFGLALDNTNNIYIANGSAHNIAKFNNQGEKIATIGRSGDGDGQFDHYDSPRDVAVTSQGTIYAIDNNKSRIEKFDRDGHFLALWNLPDVSEGREAEAFKIAVDSKEQIYLAIYDTGIWKYDSSGNFLGIIGTDLPSKYKLDNVWDLTLDANDNLYVAQPISVFKFDSAGKFITSWEIKTFDLPNNTNLVQNIEVDRLGNIYVNNNNIIEKFDGKGNFLLSWIVNIDTKYLSEINGIAIDSENRVYILNSYEQRVEIFDGQGHALRQWSISWPKWLQAGQPFFMFCFYFFVFSNTFLVFVDLYFRKHYKFTEQPIKFKAIKEFLIANTQMGRVSQILIVVGSGLGVILGYFNFRIINDGGNLLSLLGLSIGPTSLAVLAVFLNSILAYTALLVAKKPFLAGILQITGVLLLVAFSPIDPLRLVLNILPLLLGGVLALRTSLEITRQFRPGSPG